MPSIPIVLSMVLMAPYLAWGFYALRRRYAYQDDLPPAIEGLTLVAVAAFYFVQYLLIRVWADRDFLTFIFSMLGLLLSGLALYGHMLISLISQLLVDMVMERGGRDRHEPRMGPARALERQEDYEGALQEYLVLARIFPTHSGLLRRIAACTSALRRPEEAVLWLERAYKHASSANEALEIVSRLAEVLERRLGNRERARSALHQYLKDHAEGPGRGDVRERLEGLEKAPEALEETAPEGLDALREHPLYREAQEQLAQQGREQIGPPPEQGAAADAPALMPLEDAPLNEEPEEEAAAQPRGESGLEIEEIRAPLTEETPEEEHAAPGPDDLVVDLQEHPLAEPEERH